MTSELLLDLPDIFHSVLKLAPICLLMIKQTGERSIERRQAQRIKDNILVFCTQPGKYLTPVKCYTEDLSKSGCRIVADTLFSPKEKLDLEIYQPYDLNKNVIISITVISEVVWTEEIKIVERGKVIRGYRMGMNFLESREQDISVVENYIKLYCEKNISEIRKNIE